MGNHNFYPKPSKHWIKECGTIRSLVLTGHHIKVVIFRACMYSKNGHQKDICYDEIVLCVQTRLLCLIVYATVICIKRTRLMTLSSHCFASSLKLESF